MLTMLSVMLLVLGVAPFTMSAHIRKYTYYDACDEFTLAKDMPGIVAEIDNPRCHCIDSCIRNHVETLFLNSGQPTQTEEEAYGVFLCGQSCFEPNYDSISFGFLTQSPVYVRFMHDLTLKKPVYLSESELYKVLTTGLDDGPYKRLISVLNDTLLDMVAAHTKDGTQEDIGHVCFRNILQYSYDYEKINMLLEKQLYCRKSLQCLDVLLQHIITYWYNHGQPDVNDIVIPQLQSWDYYSCVRHTFLEANPVRYTPKTTTTTMAPISTRRPKKVPWICHTVIGMASYWCKIGGLS